MYSRIGFEIGSDCSIRLGYAKFFCCWIIADDVAIGTNLLQRPISKRRIEEIVCLLFVLRRCSCSEITTMIREVAL